MAYRVPSQGLSWVPRFVHIVVCAAIPVSEACRNGNICAYSQNPGRALFSALTWESVKRLSGIALRVNLLFWSRNICKLDIIEMSFDIVQMQLSFKFKSTTCKTKCCKISRKGHTDIIVVWPWVNRIFRPPNRPPKDGRLRVGRWFRPWFRRPKNPIELPPWS